VLYSDGVTEMRNSAGELFGEDRLKQCVEGNRALEPADLVNANGNLGIFAGAILASIPAIVLAGPVALIQKVSAA